MCLVFDRKVQVKKEKVGVELLVDVSIKEEWRR